MTIALELKKGQRKQLSGNHAAAWGARTSRAEIIPAYPITPQTDAVEELSNWIESGEMDAKFLRMESEHSVGAALVGAAMTGARTFTATSGQGTLYMMEMLYWLAGMRLPAGICTANRGIAPPWNIWADHQEVSALRTSGMVLAIESSPEAVYDAIPQMYKVCEGKEVLLPWVLSYDGFRTSHRFQSFHVIDPEEMREVFLPQPPEKGWPHVFMDPNMPASYGMLQHPENGAFAELQAKKHEAMLRAIPLFDRAAEEYEEIFSRYHGGMVREYFCDDAEAILVSAGSLADQAEVVVKQMRKDGKKVGAIKLRVVRPFPKNHFKKYLDSGVKLAVLDRNIDFSLGAMIVNDIRASIEDPRVYGTIGGLGGRSVGMEHQKKILESLLNNREPPQYVNMDAGNFSEINFGMPKIESNMGREMYERARKRFLNEQGNPIQPEIGNQIEEKWVGYKDGYGRLLLRGNTSCAGCGSTLGLRHILDILGSNTAVVSPASCANVYIGLYPRSASAVPWTNMAFAAGAAAASGMKAGFERKGKKMNVICWAGDGGTYDIGLQSLSGAAERGDDIIYICYNNAAYMNTGTQASSATPWGAMTTTTPKGKVQTPKNLPLIIAQHGVPYVATISPGHLGDLKAKVKKAKEYAGKGLRYLEMFTPCPPGWSFPTDKSIGVAELAVTSGAWVLFEVEDGIFRLTDSSKQMADYPKSRTPIERYLELQGRYKGILKDPEKVELIREKINQTMEYYKGIHGKKIAV